MQNTETDMNSFKNNNVYLERIKIYYLFKRHGMVRDDRVRHIMGKRKYSNWAVILPGLFKAKKISNLRFT